MGVASLRFSVKSFALFLQATHHWIDVVNGWAYVLALNWRYWREKYRAHIFHPINKTLVFYSRVRDREWLFCGTVLGLWMLHSSFLCIHLIYIQYIHIYIFINIHQKNPRNILCSHARSHSLNSVSIIFFSFFYFILYYIFNFLLLSYSVYRISLCSYFRRVVELRRVFQFEKRSEIKLKFYFNFIFQK